MTNQELTISVYVLLGLVIALTLLVGIAIWHWDKYKRQCYAVAQKNEKTQVAYEELQRQFTKLLAAKVVAAIRVRPSVEQMEVY